MRVKGRTRDRVTVTGMVTRFDHDPHAVRRWGFRRAMPDTKLCVMFAEPNHLPRVIMTHTVSVTCRRDDIPPATAPLIACEV